MDQKSLIRIIDTIIKKRLKPIIKEVIREEVKKQVTRVLHENTQNTEYSMISHIDDEYTSNKRKIPIGEHVGPRVTYEEPIKMNSQFTVSKPHFKNENKEKKNFSKNTLINDILNDTDDDYQFKEGQPVLNNNHMNTLPEGINPIVEHVPRDISNLPPFLQNAFTKNYSDIIKKSEEKTKQRRGII